MRVCILSLGEEERHKGAKDESGGEKKRPPISLRLPWEPHAVRVSECVRACGHISLHNSIAPAAVIKFTARVLVRHRPYPGRKSVMRKASSSFTPHRGSSCTVDDKRLLFPCALSFFLLYGDAVIRLM